MSENVKEGIKIIEIIYPLSIDPNKVESGKKFSHKDIEANKNIIRNNATIMRYIYRYNSTVQSICPDVYKDLIDRSIVTVMKKYDMSKVKNIDIAWDNYIKQINLILRTLKVIPVSLLNKINRVVNIEDNDKNIYKLNDLPDETCVIISGRSLHPSSIVCKKRYIYLNEHIPNKDKEKYIVLSDFIIEKYNSY